jgi:uncharacterized protein with HEPN domain
LRDWLARAQQVVDAGKEAYDADDLLQEAGDSLMMKIGEAANRLSRAGVAGPKSIEWSNAIDNRNWLIHQYDQIDREITWATLTKSLAAWRLALVESFDEAESSLTAENDTN